MFGQSECRQMVEPQIAGWGVVRVDPWHLVGIFESQTDALKHVQELSSEYVVRYGNGFPGSDDFFWEAVERSN